MNKFEDFETELDNLGIHAPAAEYYRLMGDLMSSALDIDDDTESLLMLVQQQIINNKRALA